MPSRRERLARWGKRAKKARLLYIGEWLFVPTVVGISLLLIYLDPFPDNPNIPRGFVEPKAPSRWVGWIVYGFGFGTVITAVTSVAIQRSAEWSVSKLPGTEPDVGVLLAKFSLVFGLGVVLQLTAVATP